MMKRNCLIENKEKNKRGWGKLLALFLAALLALGISMPAMAEEISLNDLLLKTPEIYTYWAAGDQEGWAVKPGVPYVMRLTFQETEEKPFARGGEAMTFSFPEQIAPVADGEEHFFSVWAGSALARGKYIANAQDKTIAFYWDETSEAYDALINAGNRQFSVDVPFLYQGNGESIQFASGMAVPVILGEYQEMYYGQALPENGGLVESGEFNGAQVESFIPFAVNASIFGNVPTGSALKEEIRVPGAVINPDSFYAEHIFWDEHEGKKTETLSLAASGITVKDVADQSFTLTLPDMEDKEEYIIHFYANVDQSKAENSEEWIDETLPLLLKPQWGESSTLLQENLLNAVVFASFAESENGSGPSFILRKVNQEGAPLTGAAYRLEERLSDGTLRPVYLDGEKSGETTFVYSSLPAGDYLLTETVAPAGYVLAAPQEFTVTLDSRILWWGTPEALRNAMYVMTALTPDGQVTWVTHKEAGMLEDPDIVVIPPTLNVKTDDYNASDIGEDAAQWVDSSDYDMGQAVPFRLEATLANNVSFYYQYRVTFIDTMEAGLMDTGHYSVALVRNGQEAPLSSSMWSVHKTGDQSFALTVTFGDGTAALPSDLNGAALRVYFEAVLTEEANIGPQGTVNAARLEYPAGPIWVENEQGEVVPNEEMDSTGEDKAIVFTYQLKVNKVDEDGQALPGAQYRLEKKVAPRTPEEQETRQVFTADEEESTDTEFLFIGIDAGEYELIETNAPAGFILAAPVSFTVTADHQITWNGQAETRTQVLTGLNVEKEFGEIELSAEVERGLVTGQDALNVKVPEFELKTFDVNDSQPQAEETVWADSADYDVGDSVPFRIRVKLPANVSSYKAYQVSLDAHLPQGLTANGDCRVTVGDADFTAFEEKALEGGFTLVLPFGNGEENLAADYNRAEVFVYFTATLNDKAVIGEEGNPITAVMRYSNSPIADTENETDPETAVIFTYAVTVNKVDENGEALPGAAFKLEKKLNDGTAKEIPAGENSTESAFVFTGLDDGDYVLTEVTAPEGFLLAVPAEFTITADHASAWNGDGSALLSLNAEKGKGDIRVKADVENGSVSLEALNVKEREIQLKVDDINDSNPDENETVWQDVADYDRGDNVPFRLSAKLPGNVSSYQQYTFTFVNTLEPGLSINKDYRIMVGENEFRGYTAQDTENGFNLTLTWDGGEENLPEDLNGQDVVITFTARLNEKAVVGGKGNAVTSLLRYPESPEAEENLETEADKCLVFTYALQFEKVDENGQPLTGASFKLEKKLAGGGVQEIAPDTGKTGGHVFAFTGLDDGDYILTETKAPSGYVPASPTAISLLSSHAAEWDGEEESREKTVTELAILREYGDMILTGSAATGLVGGTAVNVPEPVIEEKVDDKNESSTVENDVHWVDSADYAIGDSVPLRIAGALVSNVSNYKQYTVTFQNTLEEGLTNNKDYRVTVNGEDYTAFTVEDTDRGFDLTITFGDGTSSLPADLNNAEIMIYFTATLNSSARTGAEGNASVVRMKYSINPYNGDMGETPEDRVLVLTYRLAVNVVDENGAVLSGAAFTLDKQLADGTTLRLRQDAASSTETLVSFVGLDDGDYILTETKAPDGYVITDSMSFTIKADHTVVWNGDLFTRSYVLTNLSGTKAVGEIVLGASRASGVITANVLNTSQPIFEKKVDDMNDSTNAEDAVEWIDSADYDIGDNVRFLLRAKLPANVNSYKQYHVVFEDSMEKGLTNNRDYRVTVGGKEVKNYTVKDEDHAFTLTLSWDDQTALTEETNGAEIQVLYTAQLNENARVGAEGNVNSARMRYSNSITTDSEAETEYDRVIVYTYRFTVNKADEGGKPLADAAFKLEKVLSNGTRKQIPLDTNTSTETAFSFRGLDDGRYVLTETKAPNGYLLATPIEFTITAAHDKEWNANLYTRSAVLTDLTAATDSTAASIRTDKEVWNLRTTLINQRSDDTATERPGGYRNRFYFTKVWLGDVEESIDFTLYNPNGSERRKSFNKTKVSDTEFLYEAWFSDWSEFYVVEEPVPGYKVRYENVGSHAGETDRCYNGGKIINYKVPKTGDSFNPYLWGGITLVGLAGLAALVLIQKKRRGAHK